MQKIICRTEKSEKRTGETLNGENAYGIDRFDRTEY